MRPTKVDISVHYGGGLSRVSACVVKALMKASLSADTWAEFSLCDLTLVYIKLSSSYTDTFTDRIIVTFMVHAV